MPRYYFNVRHRISEIDAEGVELADIHAAEIAAVKLCGELIKELDGNFWEAPVWRLEVTNAEQKILFRLTFSGDEHSECVQSSD